MIDMLYMIDMRKEDKIIQKLIEHDERLERIENEMATKKEVREILDTLDAMTTILKHLDQERILLPSGLGE